VRQLFARAQVFSSVRHLTHIYIVLNYTQYYTRSVGKGDYHTTMGV
jgi:hypothetical protein